MQKQIRHRKIKTTYHKVVKLRLLHPEWKLYQIGNEVGKTKQWVRKALYQAGLSTHFYNPVGICEVCGNSSGVRRYKVCSLSCWHKKYWIETKCRICEKKLEVRKQTIVYRKKVQEGLYNTYCSFKCYYIGKRLGWS
ncbi:hypothetical protein HYS94_01565 [Candidatus Daviesbacteria bacterium]|nr:hypothetical protein [Candidatus Daviesbacteria bacterium]